MALSEPESFGGGGLHAAAAAAAKADMLQATRKASLATVDATAVTTVGDAEAAALVDHRAAPSIDPTVASAAAIPLRGRVGNLALPDNNPFPSTNDHTSNDIDIWRGKKSSSNDNSYSDKSDSYSDKYDGKYGQSGGGYNSKYEVTDGASSGTDPWFAAFRAAGMQNTNMLSRVLCSVGQRRLTISN
jgi:hypothetical protein